MRGRMLVIERPELDGPKPLDVERMEILVADEREPAKVRAADSPLRAGLAVSNVEFLCSSPPPPWRNTLRKRYLLNGRKPQKRRVSCHELFELLGRLLAIPRTELADVDQKVLAAVDLELMDRRIPGDDRRIDQRVVVIGSIMVRQAVGRGLERGHRLLPLRRQLEPDFVRPASLLDQRDERRRTVEHPQVVADVVGRDRRLLADEPVATRRPWARRRSRLAIGSSAGARLPAAVPSAVRAERSSTRFA